MSFTEILSEFRRQSFSSRNIGERFEMLIQAFLLTDPRYAHRFKFLWLWHEFPGRVDFGGKDTGIDLVGRTHEGEYWAIQCKCFQEDTHIDKKALDSFLATSSKQFQGIDSQTVGFSQRLWVSTTNKWGETARKTIQNQNPPVAVLNLQDLIDAPVQWENLRRGLTGDLARTEKKNLRNHQRIALNKTHQHFKNSDRGKLIMACGTGKTFTSLRIAEKQTDGKGTILFLAPSIALVGQTLREWSADAHEPIHAICICSDPKVSKKSKKDVDTDITSVVDLALPASTDVVKISEQIRKIRTQDKPGMTVIFATYQSIDVVSKTQKALRQEYGIDHSFDLIICDEAHRTTGVKLANEDASSFIKVHDHHFIQAKKRLYMTATPRLFSDDSKSKAVEANAELCSMDDPEKFGEEMYRIGFGEAVEKDLLTDYKVLVLTLSENDITPAVQKMISDQSNEISTDDVSKLIGCINALSKQILGDEGLIKSSDPEPMRRAVAFCAKVTHSKEITNIFNTTSPTYLDSLEPTKKEHMITVASEHIDGTMSAPKRDDLLGWLKAEATENECRVLTNVRCLSEGVDVPSLDAVMFLSARNSQVDVVQSVGRVMRKANGKKYGYIIIPVFIPSDIEPSIALAQNERFKVVWTVLNALRAHDDRFNATINKIELNKKRPKQIIVGGVDYGSNTQGPSEVARNLQTTEQQLSFQFEELQSVIFARMVQKVGDRVYWEKWAKDVAIIAENQVERIKRITADEGEHQNAFETFLRGLQRSINPSITKNQAIEMLAQHIITKPIFEALFEDYSFVKSNAISASMQAMLNLLEGQSLADESEKLQKFYDSVRKRAAGIDNAEGKQKIIIELYDKFFRTAFPKMVEQLGIVYTPVEVVDFIIHSVNDVLKQEFGRTLSDENVHILDPFTGTGTFITRLLQSGLIAPKDLERKFKHELHANEIVLLAYYIAAVNIENAFHDQLPQDSPYQPFDGIVLTDTFQLGETDESEKLFSEVFQKNSERVERQKKAPLRVIIGNPPYSVGQKSANDNAQNQKYDKLDKRIAETYVEASTAILKNSLYDSYIKAFRWSTDRLDPMHGGMIAFVSNGSWLDGNSSDGFRKTLEQEFTNIWVFNLRGNQRTSGELSRKEGGKIFGSGSRAPIAITLLVKNPKNSNDKATIYYRDIGDYHNRDKKLNIIKKHKSILNIPSNFRLIKPDSLGDWINQTKSTFKLNPLIGDKKTNHSIYFIIYSNGIKTQRDIWCYNSHPSALAKNIKTTILFYMSQQNKFLEAMSISHNAKPEDYAVSSPANLSWTRSLRNSFSKSKKIHFCKQKITTSIYRPFFKQSLYLDRSLVEEVGLMPQLFPNSRINNLLICVSGIGGTKERSSLITNFIPDLNLLDAGTQCFPLYYYVKQEKTQRGLFDNDTEDEYIRHDGISDFICNRAQQAYGKQITKEDIFYYVYGFLHSPEYRTTFANDLKKSLPRLPLADKAQDFWAFSKAGRQLADLHINYEAVPPCETVEVTGEDSNFFTVQKMKFPKKGQKDTIIYNSKISISNIPDKAYQYIVNGKSAIEWIMDRYQIKTDKKSGITNDPNDWAKEVGNPRYILDLMLSIINVSLQSVDIVNNLPKLTFK